MKEDQICKQFISCLRSYENLNQIIVDELSYFHIPNGGKRNPAEGKKFKDMGVLPGVPDYQFMWVSGGVFNIAYIEFKTAIGTQQKSQKDFEAKCKKMNIPYEIARSSDDGIGILKKWRILR